MQAIKPLAKTISPYGFINYTRTNGRIHQSLKTIALCLGTVKTTKKERKPPA
jgi:hypothetical protein